jgi:hypothetical protein
MLIIFFDSHGIVHKEFVPEGKTVNAEFYKGVMNRLLKGIQRVRPAAFCARDFFLLHDNAPAHKAAICCQFLTPKNVTTFYHPPYSPDLSPPDYFLFPKLKINLKGLHFADVTQIQKLKLKLKLKFAMRGLYSTAALYIADCALAPNVVPYFTSRGATTPSGAGAIY